jgi:hypothetical protein
MTAGLVDRLPDVSNTVASASESLRKVAESMPKSARKASKAVSGGAKKATKAVTKASARARDAVADTGERVASSGHGRMLAAGALAAAAAGAAVARSRQAANGANSERGDQHSNGGENGRPGNGLAHRAVEALTGLASQIASVIPGVGSSRDQKPPSRKAEPGALPKRMSENARRERSRELREEFDRGWDA